MLPVPCDAGTKQGGGVEVKTHYEYFVRRGNASFWRTACGTQAWKRSQELAKVTCAQCACTDAFKNAKAIETYGAAPSEGADK